MRKTLRTSEESFILNWMKLPEGEKLPRDPMDLLIFGLVLLGLFVSGRNSSQVSILEVLNSCWRN